MEKNPSAEKLAGGSTGFEKGAAFLREQIKTLPTLPGVYRMKADDGTVLYVGKAKDLKKRVVAYTQAARLPNRLQRMVAQTRGFEIVTTRTEAEALLLEANLIQRFMPPFNVLLRDDKSYPYILITRDHEFPQIIKYRGKQDRKGWIFGPFASTSAVNETLLILQRGFKLRNCTDSFFAARTRPCLQYHIKRCTAPCVGKVICEAYAEQVAEARDFLSGKSQEIQKQLATMMQKASDTLDYEKAAELRDRIRILTSMQARQTIHAEGLGDADVIGLWQEGGKTAIEVFFFRGDRNYGTRTFFPSHDKGVSSADIMAAFLAQFYEAHPAPPLVLLSEAPSEEKLLIEALREKTHTDVVIITPQRGKKKEIVEHALQNARSALARKMAESSEQTRLLKRVAELFELAERPNRIEVYDNSHIQGSHAIGAMIAAGPEGFLRKTYRKFDIKEATPGDDFGMMREVLTRRFKRLGEEDPERTKGLWPDLILLDGGKGQLSSVLEVLEELGIADQPVVSIAKGPDRNAGREHFFLPNREGFDLPHEDPVLYYLQRLRDEAHRFAIGTHRAKRVKAIGISGLEEVPGIGAARKKALLHHFGSGKAVKEAGVEELAKVDGISAAMAQKIHDYFKRGE